MSLKQFVKQADTVKLLNQIRVKPALAKITNLVELCSGAPKAAQRLGTAFDYLIRFEFQRVAPHSLVQSWVAENSLSPEGYRVPNNVDPYDMPTLKKLMELAAKILTEAKLRLSEFLLLKNPVRSDYIKVAESALLLAQLDVIYRSNELPEGFGEILAIEVDELVDLIEIVPTEFVEVGMRSTQPHLNPTFGGTSNLVGGADADLIIDQTLIDIKTVSTLTIDQVTHHQLLGYYLLARRHRLENPSFPEIKEVGIYFSRHAYLWKMPVTQWTDHPDFLEVERRFFELAQAKFR